MTPVSYSSVLSKSPSSTRRLFTSQPDSEGWMTVRSPHQQQRASSAAASLSGVAPFSTTTFSSNSNSNSSGAPPHPSFGTTSGRPIRTRPPPVPGATIFVAGVPGATTPSAQAELKTDLKKHFSNWAPVRGIKLIHSKTYDAYIKCAFAEFETAEDARRVLEEARGSIFQGCTLRLEPSKGDRTVRFVAALEKVDTCFLILKGGTQLQVDTSGLETDNEGLTLFNETLAARIATTFGELEAVDQRWLEIEQQSVIDVVMSTTDEAHNIIEAFSAMPPASNLEVTWPHFSGHASSFSRGDETADNSGASSSGLQLPSKTVAASVHAPSWVKVTAASDVKSLSHLTGRDWSSTPDLTSLRVENEFPSITQVRVPTRQEEVKDEQHTPSEEQTSASSSRDHANDVAPPSDLTSSVTQSETAHSSRPSSRTHKPRNARRKADRLQRRLKLKHAGESDATATAVDVAQLDHPGVASWADDEVGIASANVEVRPTTPPNIVFDRDDHKTATKPLYTVSSKLDDSPSLTEPITPSFGDISRSASFTADTSVSSAVNNTQTSTSSPEQGKGTDTDQRSLDVATVQPVVVSPREGDSHTTVLLLNPQPERTKLGAEYEPRAIWVGSLHHTSGEEDIRELFADCGPILEVVVKGGVALRYAFVTFVDDEGLSEALRKHGTPYRGRILQVRKKIKTTAPGFRGRRGLASLSLGRNSNSPVPRAKASFGTSETHGSLLPSPFEDGGGSFSGQARDAAEPGGQRQASALAASTAVHQQPSPAMTALPLHTTSGSGTTPPVHVSEDLPQSGSTQRASHRPGNLHLNASLPTSTVSSNFADELSKSSDLPDPFLPGLSTRSVHGADATRRSPQTRRRLDVGAGLPAKPSARSGRAFSNRGKAPAQSQGDALAFPPGLAAPFYPSEAAPPHPPPPMMPQPYAVTYINGQMVHVLPPVTLRQGTVPPPTLPYEQYASLVANSAQASQGQAAEGTGSSTPAAASELQPTGMTAPHPFYDFHQTESAPVEYSTFTSPGAPNGEDHGGGPAGYGWPPMVQTGWQYGQQFPPFVPMYGPPMYAMHSPQSAMAPVHQHQAQSHMGSTSTHGDMSAPGNRRTSHLGHAPVVSQIFPASSAHRAQDLASREGFSSSSSEVFGIPRGHPHYTPPFYPAHNTHFHQP